MKGAGILHLHRARHITALVYKELLALGVFRLPITENHAFFHDGRRILISSMQAYALRTGVNMEALTLQGRYEDGLCLRGLRPGVDVILYNREKTRCRKRFTVLHELGHIKCGHILHGKNEETEAHFFASQFLMPSILLSALEQRGYHLNTELLVRHFVVSPAAAEVRLRQYTQEKAFDDSLLPLPEEEALLQSFEAFLNESFPYVKQRLAQ